MKEKDMKENEAGDINEVQATLKESIPDILDVIPRSNDKSFHFPLLSEFVKEQNPRDATLLSSEIVTGTYGENAIVYFEGHNTGYRCSSKTVLEQVKKIIEKGTFPLKVHVARIQTKDKRHHYYVLNAIDRDIRNGGEENEKQC